MGPLHNCRSAVSKKNVAVSESTNPRKVPLFSHVAGKIKWLFRDPCFESICQTMLKHFLQLIAVSITGSLFNLPQCA
jgi:hypothetical protein